MFQGGVFTRDFLSEGIAETDVWQSLGQATVESARARLAALFDELLKIRNPGEAVTEKDLIYPVLSTIGWGDLVFVQPNLSKKGRTDVPDALLFGDERSFDLGKKEPENWLRFQHGRCLVEAKRWNRVLDREDKRDRDAAGVPSTQMLRYLRRADDITQGGLRWGILTNGRHWRLYWQGAVSVAEDFLEIDLGKVFDLPGCELDLLDKRPERIPSDEAWRDHALRLFLIFFGKGAFEPDTAGKTFHEFAIAEGRFWEQRVARDLSDRVFDEVFPRLVSALESSDPQRDPKLGQPYLDEVKEGALFLLYRLLFVLYAEDRNLLPDESGPYRPYSLTAMRVEIAEKQARSEVFSDRMTTYWPRLKAIMRAIGDGDDALGIPPYDGGLFDPAMAPILERTEISDAVLSEVVFRLSHDGDRKSSRGAKYINYRDLSVQQLGSVYERILERGLQVSGEGKIEIAEDADARHKSGSFYTPEDLVSLIIERTVGPLVEERLRDFTEMAAQLASDTRAKQARIAELSRLDPASRILSLRILDPAMGSGHFLVSLVDWLADRVLAAIAEAEQSVEWADYESPVASRVEIVRETIVQEARARGWPIVEAQLDDRHIVRRMVLKRVVHGVDKNPMAVELAKVSLWLHSFTVGAPLSFLDHHLRCGDSVVGAWVRPTLDRITERGALFNTGQIARVEHVASLMSQIEASTDNDIAEVEASKEAFKAVEEAIAPVASLFSLLTAESLMGVFDAAPKKAPRVEEAALAKKPERAIKKARADAKAFERASALQLVLEGSFGDPIRIASGEERVAPPEIVQQFALLASEDLDPQGDLFPALSTDDRRRWIADRIVEEARALAERHRFFHWEIGFPNVWSNLTSAQASGGFDAVIGNPPYVRQELLGELKPALKKAYQIFDGVADLYVYFYEQGLRLLKPGGRMGFVVTNKWLRAGYAEGLRTFFADPKLAEVRFLADFGHAKHFFPDADVFPSVLVVRKPGDHEAKPEADICVIPRDAVPKKDLGEAVEEATFPLPLAAFAKEGWTLEPKPVMDLLDKIRRNGVPLADYAGVTAYRGILTGLNEAFLIDAATRDRLISEDPACAHIIKTYLRGQDIERWWSPPSGLYMIVMKSSVDHPWPWANAPDEATAERSFAETYPSLYSFMKRFEKFNDPKSGKVRGLRYREDQGRFWWELRSCTYYEAFEKPKIVYQEIGWSQTFQVDRNATYLPNTAYLLTTTDESLLAVLNSPVFWWWSWRKAMHGKDEALRLIKEFIVTVPVPEFTVPDQASISDAVAQIESKIHILADARRAILDWLHHEFGIQKPGRALSQPHRLDVDAFVASVRAALPKRQNFSAADIARLKQEHHDTVEPAREAAAEILVLERKLSDLVNAAYGLTPEDVKLMWETAPPRMPLDPAEELKRLSRGLSS